MGWTHFRIFTVPVHLFIHRFFYMLDGKPTPRVSRTWALWMHLIWCVCVCANCMMQVQVDVCGLCVGVCSYHGLYHFCWWMAYATKHCQGHAGSRMEPRQQCNDKSWDSYRRSWIPKHLYLDDFDVWAIHFVKLALSWSMAYDYERDPISPPATHLCQYPQCIRLLQHPWCEVMNVSCAL